MVRAVTVPVKRLVAAVAVAFTVAVVGVGAHPGVVSAQGDPAEILVVHALPGVAADVYLDGVLLAHEALAGAVVGPLQAEVGSREVTVFAAVDSPPAAADERADAALVAGRPDTRPGELVSVVVHLDAGGAPTVSTFLDDRTPTAPGQGRVSLRHVAAAPPLDVVVNGASVPGLTGVDNGEAATIDLAAGRYPTAVAAAGTTEVLADAPIVARDGIRTVVYAIGSVDDGTFELLVDERADDAVVTPPAEVAAGDSGLRVTGPSPAETAGGPGAALLVTALVGSGIAVLVGARRFGRRRGSLT
jgi:hypothetical protein